jgi:hypothetical protein
VALLNQFALAQQQMFDQFQQVVLAMVETMATLHRSRRTSSARNWNRCGS